MADVRPAPPAFPVTVETLIIGAGAAGLVAALSAVERGQEVLVLEATAMPAGSTALSAGLIPAAGTRFQTGAGIGDTPERFAADIQRKARGENDPALVALLTARAAEAIEWLADAHGLPFSVVADFDYPGHSRRRMHGLPSRSGQELIDRLRTAAERAGIDILCEARVTTLFADGTNVAGVAMTRPDGTEERIGCGRLILACNGFGGNRSKVAQHMPEIADALWFGHDANRGEALDWARALGAATRNLSAYQGHGNVAHPHGVLITWATITEGGIQVDASGTRFWNETQGYSEAARVVLGRPGGIAFTIFDERIAAVARQFTDFQEAEKLGAVRRSQTLAGLAAALDLPGDRLAATIAGLPYGGTDCFGRTFSPPKLGKGGWCGVRVTGALFHTQGGLVVNDLGQVVRPDGTAIPGLYAAGGAACGVSGSGDAGYLSGNGLLSAIVLGRICGEQG